MKRLLTVALLLLVCAHPMGVAAQDGRQGGAAIPQGGRGGGAGRGPVRDVRDRPAGTSVIRGRIMTADTGTAIRRAQVRAVSGSDTRLVTTDAQGTFEFRDLPAGRWELSASKAGYVTMRFGQRRALEAGRPIEVADGQLVDRINLSLPRGAAITGRVFDEFGDPVAGARVQAMRYQLVQGSRRLSPVGVTAQSDDTGAFRLYGLMPGDYYVSAILRALPFDVSEDGGGYAPTYYPGTGSVTEAQVIPLAVSQEASITFALMPVRTARVAGSVVNSMGAPLAGGMVVLVGAEGLGPGPVMFGAGNRIRPDGSFLLTNVAPGSYNLTATSGGPGPFGGPGGGAGGAAEIEMGSIPVAVAGEDLAGITLVTSRGATLSGIVGATQGSTGKIQASDLQIVAQPVSPERGVGPGGGARPARVESDGTFTLTNLFGRRMIRINGLPADWMLDGVFAGGTDVTDTPIDFGPNEQLTDVQIVVTDRVTQVAGTVTGRDGKPTREFTVVVFPDEETKWAAPSRYLRTARPDQDGLFKIRALPPGAGYLAVAVDYLEQGEGNDPEFLASIKDSGTRFRLGAGESATVNLKIVER
ncbi:MAG: carboxypeptidase regulatory-like domain-containing protein [Acidobacteria bacterium]|nr:carboxypeptidase regulatory-like domain-containing protein [Acidobacteriota bacterium]